MTGQHASRAAAVAAVGLWLAAAAVVQGSEPSRAARFSAVTTSEGIEVAFDMRAVSPAVQELREGDAVEFHFRIKDTTTGSALSGAYPAAWMDLRPAGEEAVECKKKVESFLGGTILAPAELDLNVYYVLALNDNATISVVDPLFGFGTTKLLAQVILESPGEDWALAEDQERLFVSMPDSSAVAVVETATWEVVTNLTVGARPRRIALQPDGRFLWVAHDRAESSSQASGVEVFSVSGLARRAEILTGNGRHDIAFSDDSLFAFVTNEDDGTVSVIDMRRLEKIKDVETGSRPVSIAFSRRARAAYAANAGDGTVVAIELDRLEVTARMQAPLGLGQIGFPTDGRYGFVLSPQTDEVFVIDTASNRIIQNGHVEKSPDQLAFSDELVYVRHRDSETVLMIALDQVGSEGTPLSVIDFPGGQRPFGDGSLPSLAASIVQAPGATAVLVANPADGAIYYYKEGMAAPMGNFRNYGAEPRAVIVVDRSLHEKAPGDYTTTASLRRPGLYDVAFFLDSPRMTHCFEVRVEPNAELEAERKRRRPLIVEPLIEARELTQDKPGRIRFRLSDPAGLGPKTDLDDVQILTLLAPGIWHQRQWATSSGQGIYEVDFSPPKPGVYYVNVAARSSGLEFYMHPSTVIHVDEPMRGPTRKEEE